MFAEASFAAPSPSLYRSTALLTASSRRHGCSEVSTDDGCRASPEQTQLSPGVRRSTATRCRRMLRLRRRCSPPQSGGDPHMPIRRWLSCCHAPVSALQEKACRFLNLSPHPLISPPWSKPEYGSCVALCLVATYRILDISSVERFDRSKK